MSKRPSLVQQVSRALQGIAHIGESRHAAKEAGTAPARIHSWESLRSHRQRSITALRRLNDALPHDQRLQLLRDWRPEHSRQVKALMVGDGLSQGFIKNTLSSLRKLGYAVQAAGWNKLSPEQLVPADLYDGLGQPKPRGGYSPAQAEQIIAHVAGDTRYGETFATMLQLLRSAGLRHTELARLRESDLNRATSEIAVRSANAKGGRERLITLDATGQERLREVIGNIPTGRNWLWMDGPSVVRRLQDAVREACDDLGIERKGIHAFRALFAEEYVDRRMAEGLSQNGARDALSVVMGHNRRSVTYRYVPRKS